MKKVTFNLIVGAGLILGTAALFGQKSFNTITPVTLAEKKQDIGVEGTWKLYKADGKVVKENVTKIFAANGVIITKYPKRTTKTKWKIENGKLCTNDYDRDEFQCNDYKVTKTTLTYTFLNSEIIYTRK
ncbi:hypothetical protein [Chryseobacterium sp. 3008163]|uniref:hypothetical protein n=1 Tax=Chryseobacterium sp. 3008163 TaxID=2478663 RepID=UPI000F0CA122|nr:hypothetical protein [Chryseobacterium sp. 3008163]AYM99743.1 hypothetical protein EAG08_04795 [Chryseobacterium sp. 3008163]